MNEKILKIFVIVITLTHFNYFSLPGFELDASLKMKIIKNILNIKFFNEIRTKFYIGLIKNSST